MADDQERFEAELDLDVSFNEFDEELSEFNEGNCDPNLEAAIANGKETKQHSSIATFTKDTCEHTEDIIPNVSNGNCTDNEKHLLNIEDGEISVSSDDEEGEKMDFLEGIAADLNPVQTATKSAEACASKEMTIDNFTFLPPSSVVENLNKNEPLNEEFLSDTAKRVVETESVNVSMESDNSMDDQSWKRHKRAKLEHGSLETGQEEMNYGKGKEVQKA